MKAKASVDNGVSSSLSAGAAAFIDRFPKVYHVSQAPSLDTIERHGLLSTTAILDLLEVPSEERQRLERLRRPGSVALPASPHGAFILNDQSPLHLNGLGKCLVGMTETEWICELNRRVFLFPSLPALDRLRSAVRARTRPKLVLEYETATLVAAHEGAISIASINTGYTLRRAATRGRHTFQPLSAYAHVPRPKVAEITVLYRVRPSIPFRVVHGFA